MPPSFKNFKSTQRLKYLAQDPFDLTLPGNLTPQRIKDLSASSCGYKLFYSTERVTEEVMDALVHLAEEAQAWEKMAMMQAGDRVNFIQGFSSENRPALHTATRDFFEQQNTAKAAQEAAQLAKQQIKKLQSFLQHIDQTNRFTDLVMIGIGGSDLGPRAHYLALRHLLKPDRHVHFIGNVDPDDTVMALKKLDLSKTLVVVVSKSGTTLETATNEAFVQRYFEAEGLSTKEHFITVSMPGTPLDNPEKYLACFHLWDWIGGRYSTTSMVGGVMLSFAFGFEVYWSLLKGANAMDKAAMVRDLNHNLPLLAALLGIWNRNFLDHQTLAIIPYSQALIRFPAHIQQLDMESHGKRIDQYGRAVEFETGPIIWGEPGTNAQHSFFQLLHQGTTIVPIEFIGFRESQLENDVKYEGTTCQQKFLANLFAQMLALATGQHEDNPNRVFLGNRPSHLLFSQRLTPYALGVLLAFYEHKIAFQGFIWGINSFDQEGVQLGKVLATKIISRFAALNDPQKPSASYPLGDTLIEEAMRNE